MSQYYKDIKEILTSEMEKLNIKIEKRRSVKENEWEYIAGENLSKLCSFSGVDKKTLLISISSSSVRTIVELNKRNIIKKFNEKYPESKVSYIRIIAER